MGTRLASHAAAAARCWPPLRRRGLVPRPGALLLQGRLRGFGGMACRFRHRTQPRMRDRRRPCKEASYLVRAWPVLLASWYVCAGPGTLGAPGAAQETWLSNLLWIPYLPGPTNLSAELALLQAHNHPACEEGLRVITAAFTSTNTLGEAQVHVERHVEGLLQAYPNLVRHYRLYKRGDEIVYDAVEDLMGVPPRSPTVPYAQTYGRVRDPATGEIVVFDMDHQSKGAKILPGEFGLGLLLPFWDFFHAPSSATIMLALATVDKGSLAGAKTRRPKPDPSKLRALLEDRHGEIALRTADGPVAGAYTIRLFLRKTGPFPVLETVHDAKAATSLLKSVVQDPTSGRITEGYVRLADPLTGVPRMLLKFSTEPKSQHTNLAVCKFTSLDLTNPVPADRFCLEIPADWLLIDQRTRRVFKSGKKVQGVVWQDGTADTTAERKGWRLAPLAAFLALTLIPVVAVKLWARRATRGHTHNRL